MLKIPFESRHFPPQSSVQNGIRTLNFDWNDLLWSALTIGRPNLHYVFQHGLASRYEAVFRLSLVRMALHQPNNSNILKRSEAVKSLDPSEKGAIHYFLGMLCCKLFADKCLHTPWLLHLDVFRPSLNPVLQGRSRPDLIGQSMSGDWVVLESKGRSSEPDSKAKERAKYQATRCLQIGSSQVNCHIGAASFFRDDTLHFYWEDPKPEDSGDDFSPQFTLDVDDSLWRHHYSSILGIISSTSGVLKTRQGKADDEFIADEAEVSVSVFPDVLKRLYTKQWGDAKRWCIENASTLARDGFRHDGTKVVAGDGWFA